MGAVVFLLAGCQKFVAVPNQGADRIWVVTQDGTEVLRCWDFKNKLGKPFAVCRRAEMLSRRIGSRLGTSSIVCRRRQRGAGGESGQLAIGLALTKAAARARSASRACPLHEVAFRFIVPNDFAANCPGDNCPPSTSTDVTGEVYRFVKSNPSTAKDFRTYADDGKKTADACQACALSVLTRAEDVPTACAAIPWFKKQKLARAVLKPEHGRIAQTGSHRWHYSLWVRAKQAEKLHELFEMVAA